MFQKKPKPLPEPVLKVVKNAPTTTAEESGGIMLGDDTYWDPAHLPNAHVVIIGASGSGKTQSLKAIAYALPKVFRNLQIFIVDFHSDQQLPGEVCYHLDMESPHGINPLTIDQDTKGGGSALSVIAVAAVLKRALSMGTNQEGLIIEILNSCYTTRGIIQSDPQTWGFDAPTFADVQAEISKRIQDGCKESAKLRLKLAATFQYGIFNRPQSALDAPLIRFDLSSLGKVPGLGVIAAQSLAKQLMDSHRPRGEIEGKIP